MIDSMPEQEPLPPSGTVAGNLGDPIKLAGIQINGISAETSRGGAAAKVYTRLVLTSDDRFFHRAAESLRSHIEHVAHRSGHAVNLKRADFVLLVAHTDDTAELWVDPRVLEGALP